MYTWLAKVISLVILLILTCVFGFLPRLIRTSGNEKLLSIANCVAGGVLMGTTLLHLLPEVMEDVENGFKQNNIDIDYPVGTLTVGLGFLLIVFIEMLAHTIQDKMSSNIAGHGHSHGPPVETDSLPRQYSLPREDTENSDVPPGCEDDVNLFDSMERVRRFTRASSKTNLERSINARRNQRLRTSDSERKPLLGDAVQNSYHPNNNVTYDDAEEKERALENPASIDEEGRAANGHGHSHDHGPPTEIKSFGSVLLLFALSVHSILEGMAVGSESDWLMVFTVTAALSVHKVLLAFALGVKIVDEGQTLAVHIRSVALFAISSPIGVAIGVGVELSDFNPATKTLVEGLIQAVATGTFLYIAFVEIITPELNKPDLSPLLKWLCLAAGYIIMICVQFIPEGEEDIDPHNVTSIVVT